MAPPDRIAVKEIIVMRGEIGQGELQKLGNALPPFVVLLHIPDSTVTLESFDEEDMRAAGWVRAEAATPRPSPLLS